MSGTSLLPDDFTGLVRLFPLPDLVMFPHVVQPLRVFEPRYVAMLEDATQDDQLITMALLQSGWETAYEGNPPIHSAVCVGRVITQCRQADGAYNLLLAGVARGQIRQELARQRPYRQAEVEVLVDEDAAALTGQSQQLKDELLQAYWQFNPEFLTGDSSIQQLLHAHVPLGMLTDIMAFAAPLDVSEKLMLLGEGSVVRRVQILIDQLRRLDPVDVALDSPWFPPSFSDN
jgi:ATP-dependent Lon protease